MKFREIEHKEKKDNQREWKKEREPNDNDNNSVEWFVPQTASLYTYQ